MSILEEAVRAVEKYGLDKRPALVVWGENWHQGVVGIVASRLVELYYRPTVVISVVEGRVWLRPAVLPGCTSLTRSVHAPTCLPSSADMPWQPD